MSKNRIIETDMNYLSITGCKRVLHYILLALVMQAMDDNVIRVQDIDDLSTVINLEMMVGKL